MGNLKIYACKRIYEKMLDSIVMSEVNAVYGTIFTCHREIKIPHDISQPRMCRDTQTHTHTHARTVLVGTKMDKSPPEPHLAR